MNKIIKWLTEHGVDFREGAVNKYRSKERKITLMIEPNCVWINGFGEPMKYDKVISIWYAPHSGYMVSEVTRYSMSHTLCVTGKSERVIQVLEERLGAK